MLLGMAAWTSEVLPNQYVQITGATYYLEMINGIDYLMREKSLKSGDNIGHPCVEGDFGESALKGSKFAAKEAGRSPRPGVQRHVRLEGRPDAPGRLETVGDPFVSDTAESYQVGGQ